MVTTITETFSLLFGSDKITASGKHVQYAFITAGIAFYLVGVRVGQMNPEGSLIGM